MSESFKKVECFTGSLASLFSISSQWIRFSGRKVYSLRFVWSGIPSVQYLPCVATYREAHFSLWGVKDARPWAESKKYAEVFALFQNTFVSDIRGLYSKPTDAFLNRKKFNNSRRRTCLDYRRVPPSRHHLIPTSTIQRNLQFATVMPPAAKYLCSSQYARSYCIAS